MSDKVLDSLIAEGQDMIDAHDYDMHGWARQAIAALVAERNRADRAEARLASVALSWAVIQGAERDILNGRPVDDALDEQHDARCAIDKCLSEATA